MGRASRPGGARVTQAGLTVHSITVGGERLAVLSYPAPATLDREDLTPAERAIAAALLRGETNAEIARQRRRSPRTIANQIAALFRKLGVSSRSELVARMTIELDPDPEEDP